MHMDLLSVEKDSKRDSKRQWADHEYHVQDRKDAQHKSVNIPWD